VPSHRVFDEFAGEYDRWFDEHGGVYEAQLRILRSALPWSGKGLEVGVGSGRFAGPLGIRYGIDPSRGLLMRAKSRGIDVVLGEGEHLPYHPDTFDVVLMMTVICFLPNPPAVFRETLRVLMPGGTCTVGFIVRGGDIWERYRREKTKGRFLQHARFLTQEEVGGFYTDAGFTRITVNTTAQGFCVMSGVKR